MTKMPPSDVDGHHIASGKPFYEGNKREAMVESKAEVSMDDTESEEENQGRVRQSLTNTDQACKASIAFILDNRGADEEARQGSHSSDSSSSKSGKRAYIKKSRLCKVDGCTRYVVNRGLCIGHGGGKRCSVEGCTSSAKNGGVCWKHGGSTQCTVVECSNRAKSRGVCWSHGGGRKCKSEDCNKTAVSNGLCWRHGGGKRCIVDGCKKPAYERNGNLCSVHQESSRSV